MKSAKNTICDSCVQNSLSYEFCDIFLIMLFKGVKRSNQLGTRFVILVYRTRGVLNFVTFLLI